MELDEGTLRRWDVEIGKISQLALDTAVMKERQNGIIERLDRQNGTVANLNEQHLVMKGTLGAMRFIMAATLAVIAAAGTITGIIIAVQQVGS